MKNNIILAGNLHDLAKNGPYNGVADSVTKLFSTSKKILILTEGLLGNTRGSLNFISHNFDLSSSTVYASLPDADTFNSIDGLIIPGGDMAYLSLFLKRKLGSTKLEVLSTKIKEGMSVLATGHAPIYLGVSVSHAPNFMTSELGPGLNVLNNYNLAFVTKNILNSDVRKVSQDPNSDISLMINSVKHNQSRFNGGATGYVVFSDNVVALASTNPDGSVYVQSAFPLPLKTFSSPILINSPDPIDIGVSMSGTAVRLV